MYKKYWPLLLFLMLSSCLQNMRYTEKEMAALDAISEHYGCRVSLEKKYSTLEGQELQYMLELEGKEMSEYHQTPVMAANLSAWMFLNSLGEEGLNLRNLKVSYLYNKELLTFTSNLEAIRLACFMTPRLSEIDMIIKTQQYDRFLPMMNPKLSKKISPEKVFAGLMKLDSLHGKVDQRIISGLKFFTYIEDSTTICVQFYGNDRRKGEFRSFDITFNPNDLDTPITGFYFQ